MTNCSPGERALSLIHDNRGQLASIFHTSTQTVRNQTDLTETVQVNPSSIILKGKFLFGSRCWYYTSTSSVHHNVLFLSNRKHTMDGKLRRLHFLQHPNMFISEVSLMVWVLKGKVNRTTKNRIFYFYLYTEETLLPSYFVFMKALQIATSIFHIFDYLHSGKIAR